MGIFNVVLGLDILQEYKLIDIYRMRLVEHMQQQREDYETEQ